MSETNGKSLKIIQLTAENIKRLQAVTITPNGESIEIIGGDNAHGKTSVLDSIMYGLAGGKTIPSAPIRKGQKKGRVEIDLGEFKVERRFTSKGSTLEVKAANGLIQNSPQAILNQLTGKLTFDPLAFVNMEPAEQLKTLKDLVGVNLDDLEAKRQNLYAERKDINAEVKSLEGQFDGIPEHSDVPDAPVVIADLMVQLEQAEQQNREVAGREREIETVTERLATLGAELERLRQRAVEIKAEQQSLESKRDSVDLPALLDTSEIKTQIASAEAINQKVRESQERKRLDGILKTKRSESTKLTLAIENIDTEKEARIANARFPVSGLSFGESGVLLNGLPLEQASAAESLKVSVAMGFALNPRLKVLLIRDGSLLDDNSLAAVAEMAKEHDGQVWIERVSKDENCSVIIEDGLIVGGKQVKGNGNESESESF